MHNKDTFLDVGCAEGLFVFEATKNCKIGIGVDFAAPFIKRAKSMSQRCSNEADFIIADAYHLPFREKTFSKVLCTEVLEHLENPISCLKEMQKACKINGKIVVSTPVNSIKGCLGAYIHKSYGQQVRCRNSLKNACLTPDLLRETHGHLSIFEPQKLLAMFDEVGLEVKRIRGIGNLPSLPFNLLNKSKTLLGAWSKLDYCLSSVNSAVSPRILSDLVIIATNIT